jgi:hypothetical protein
MIKVEKEFQTGQLVIYKKGETLQIGKVKSLQGDAAFVWYHEGDTAALTPLECLYPLENAYVIEKDRLNLEERKRQEYARWLHEREEAITDEECR